MIEVENNLQTQIHRKKMEPKKQKLNICKTNEEKKSLFSSCNKWQKYSMILCLYSKLFKCFDFNFYFISFFSRPKTFFFVSPHNLFGLVQYVNATQRAMKIKTEKNATKRWKMENNVNQNKNIRIYNILLYAVFISYHQALALSLSSSLTLHRCVSLSLVGATRSHLVYSGKNCDCKHQWFWIVVWMRERYFTHTHT